MWGIRVSYELRNNKWYMVVHNIDYANGNDAEVEFECNICDVPVGTLLNTWEGIVIELSEKERGLYGLKEEIFNKEQEIIRNTDFQKIYNKNNKDVRKEHLDKMLADEYAAKKNLEFRIDFIKQYIPLLREVVKYKIIEGSSLDVKE